MNGLPYYKAYPRDFVEGTIGMPFEVKCAYRVVIDLIYMQGGHLPDEARYISGHLGCSIRKWKSIRSELIQHGKIVVSGEFLTNKRADKELETLAKLQEKQAENARGSRKNKDLQKPRPDHTEPEPEPYSNDDTKVSSRRFDRDHGFSDFWEIWPSKKNKQNALKAWRKLSIDNRRAAYSAVKAGWFEQWQANSPDANPIHASTFLNSRRWEDQQTEPKNAQSTGDRKNGKRPIAERLAARLAGMDSGQDRDASQPLFQAGNERDDRGGGDDGLDQSTVRLFPRSDWQSM